MMRSEEIVRLALATLSFNYVTKEGIVDEILWRLEMKLQGVDIVLVRRQEQTEAVRPDGVALLLLCILDDGPKAKRGTPPGVPARMYGPVVSATTPGSPQWAAVGPHASPYATLPMPKLATGAPDLRSGHAAAEPWPNRAGFLLGPTDEKAVQAELKVYGW